MVEFVKSQHPL